MERVLHNFRVLWNFLTIFIAKIISCKATGFRAAIHRSPVFSAKASRWCYYPNTDKRAWRASSAFVIFVFDAVSVWQKLCLMTCWSVTPVKPVIPSVFKHLSLINRRQDKWHLWHSKATNWAQSYRQTGIVNAGSTFLHTHSPTWLVSYSGKPSKWNFPKLIGTHAGNQQAFIPCFNIRGRVTFFSII